MGKLKWLLILTFLVTIICTTPVLAADAESTIIHDQLREVNEASLDQLEKAMYEAGLSSSSGPMSIQSATTVYIGTDKTLTTANAGNCGWSGSGLGTHGEGFSALDSPNGQTQAYILLVKEILVLGHGLEIPYQFKVLKHNMLL